MDDWHNLAEPWDRLRWARRHAKFASAASAAQALKMEDATYRTYERATEDGGRSPGLASIQKMAAKFGVDWTWLATGKGQPLSDQQAETEAREIAALIQRIPLAKRADARNAAKGTLKSYIKEVAK